MKLGFELRHFCSIVYYDLSHYSTLPLGEKKKRKQARKRIIVLLLLLGNYHKFVAYNMNLLFYRLGGQKYKMCLHGFMLFEDSRGESTFLPFSSFGGCPYSLADSPFLNLQSQQGSIFSPLWSPLLSSHLLFSDS